jgi:hypothetical protein
VPLFLVSIFLLQTRFRPEMQEDPYYASYLLQRHQMMERQQSREVSLTDQITTLKSKLDETQRQPSDQSSSAIECATVASERDELLNRLSQLETQLNQVRKVQSEIGSSEGLLSPVGYFREINLVDSNNKVRALFTSLLDDEPALMFFGKEGYHPGNEAAHTILLESCNNGDVSLFMRNGRRNSAAHIDVSDRGYASFQIHDVGRQATAGLTVQDGEANLNIASNHLQTHIILRARANGTHWLTAMRDGKVAWTAEQSP